jgi:hypothetical protein
VRITNRAKFAISIVKAGDSEEPRGADQSVGDLGMILSQEAIKKTARILLGIGLVCAGLGHLTFARTAYRSPEVSPSVLPTTSDLLGLEEHKGNLPSEKGVAP